MDFFGMGPLELAMVLLVGVLVLGPAKIVDVGRTLGKFWGEAQRLLRETADAATIRLDAPLGQEEKPAKADEPPSPEGSVTAHDDPTSSDSAGSTPHTPTNAETREDSQQDG